MKKLLLIMIISILFLINLHAQNASLKLGFPCYTTVEEEQRRLWLDERLYKELKITRRKGGKETLKDWIITLILIFTIIGVWTLLIFS